MTLLHHSSLLIVLTAAAVIVPDGAGIAADRASQTPPQILEQVRDEIGKARRYHVSGTLRTQDGTTRMSVDVTDAGAVRLTASQGPVTFAVRAVGGTAYMRGNAALWLRTHALDAAQADAVSGQWVRLGEAEARALRTIYRRFTPRALAACTFTGAGRIVKSGSAVVGSRRVVVLRDIGDRPGTVAGRLLIARTGRALPLRIQETEPVRPGGPRNAECGRSDDETITSADWRFSNYNKVPPITAPRRAIDAEDLGDPGPTTSA